MRYHTVAAAALVFFGVAASVQAEGDPRSSPRAKAQGAGPDTVVALIPGPSIDEAVRSLEQAASAEDIARELPTGDASRYQFIVLSRRVAAPAELHESWADVVFVRSGNAVLRTGHALSERRPRSAGEWLGSIARGTDREVGPGDVVVIPAGIAHHWRPTGQGSFTYLIMKVNVRDPR
jgi:mannose-6-phosphate isomerase-like protein (cupin superfamily)